MLARNQSRRHPGCSRSTRCEEDGHHRRLWRGAAAQLKLAVHAPPLEGRANQALIVFLAETFGVPKNAVGADCGGVIAEARFFCWRGVTRE